MVQASMIAAAVGTSARTAMAATTSTSTAYDMDDYYHDPTIFHDFLSPLPKPRTKQLPPAKESQARRWIDSALATVSRRFTRTLGESVPVATDTITDATVNATVDILQPYANMTDLLCDLDEMVNFLWTTATPAIAISYMFELADNLATHYLPSFPDPNGKPGPLARDPVPTLRVLRKLDHCFASMIVGRDVSCRGQVLPTPPRRQFINATEMVRLKGIVERTRAAVVQAFEGWNGEGGDEEDEEDEDEEDYDDNFDGRGPIGQGHEDTTPALTPGMSEADTEDTRDCDDDWNADASDFEPEDDILFGAAPRLRPRQQPQGARQFMSDDYRRSCSGDAEPDVGMDIGRVYEKTLIQLGRRLHTGPFGGDGNIIDVP